MTRAYLFLSKFFPKWAVYLVLYAWYTGMMIAIIGFSFLDPVDFLYYGH